MPVVCKGGTKGSCFNFILKLTICGLRRARCTWAFLWQSLLRRINIHHKSIKSERVEHWAKVRIKVMLRHHGVKTTCCKKQAAVSRTPPHLLCRSVPRGYDCVFIKCVVTWCLPQEAVCRARRRTCCKVSSAGFFSLLYYSFPLFGIVCCCSCQPRGIHDSKRPTALAYHEACGCVWVFNSLLW